MTNNIENYSFQKKTVKLKSVVKNFLKNVLKKKLVTAYKKITKLMGKSDSAKNENGLFTFNGFLNETALNEGFFKSKEEKEKEILEMQNHAEDLLNFMDKNYKDRISAVSTHRLTRGSVNFKEIFQYNFANLKDFYLNSIRALYKREGSFETATFPSVINYVFFNKEDSGLAFSISIMSEHFYKMHRKHDDEYYVESISAYEEHISNIVSIINSNSNGRGYDFHIDLRDLKNLLDELLEYSDKNIK